MQYRRAQAVHQTFPSLHQAHLHFHPFPPVRLTLRYVGASAAFMYVLRLFIHQDAHVNFRYDCKHYDTQEYT